MATILCLSACTEIASKAVMADMLAAHFASAPAQRLRPYEPLNSKADLLLCLSACTEIASLVLAELILDGLALPQRLHRDCVGQSALLAVHLSSLPQRLHRDCVLLSRHKRYECRIFASAPAQRLRRQKATVQNVIFCVKRCEPVDSFSGYSPALTIFPSSSAAKASYDAIHGSPGRTIDRLLLRTRK